MGEETYYQVNAEAAEEVARQLRLRNLSGIIIVDFINMAEKENRQKLLEYLKMLTAGDPQHPRIVDMTPLGLVEITRKSPIQLWQNNGKNIKTAYKPVNTRLAGFLLYFTILGNSF